MQNKRLIHLGIITVTCLVLFKVYSYHKEEVTNISYIELKGAFTPHNGDVTINYHAEGMPLVHIGARQINASQSEVINDDAFSLPTITPPTVDESLIAEVTEPEPEPEPEKSPWDMGAAHRIKLQMISHIQGRPYAVINGLMVKRGDNISVQVGRNNVATIKVADVKRNNVGLVLEQDYRSFTLQ